MKPEKQNLIHDLLDEQRDTRREATLRAGGRILRARRWQRRILPALATVAILGVTAISLQRLLTPIPPVAIIATVAPAPEKKVAPIESLTDEELLTLFPDTPVALATLENGQKRLIFLRPGDAERFVGRL